MKLLFLAAFAAVFTPAIAKADLFDQRAAEARRNYEEESARNAASREANLRQSSYRLAHAFGAQHGGVFEVNILSGNKVRFNSGDGHACEAYVSLSYFNCYEPTGRGMVKFRRDDFVVATSDSYFTGEYPLAARKKSRRRAR